MIVNSLKFLVHFSNHLIEEKWKILKRTQSLDYWGQTLPNIFSVEGHQQTCWNSLSAQNQNTFWPKNVPKLCWPKLCHNANCVKRMANWVWKNFIFKNLYLKMGLHRPLFHLFTYFQTNKFYNKGEKCPSSIRCWDSNPWQLEHETPPITTRPRLPGNF